MGHPILRYIYKLIQMSCTPEVLLHYSKILSGQLAQFCMFMLKAPKVLVRWFSRLAYYRPHLCPGLTGIREPHPIANRNMFSSVWI